MNARRTFSSSLVALALAACGGHDLASGACHGDSDCGAGTACMASTCVALAPAGRTFALELTPVTDSPNENAPAYTELVAGIDGATLLRLPLDKRVRVSGLIDVSVAPYTLDNVRVVAGLASEIEPARSVTFETDARAPTAASGALAFSLLLPGTAVGRNATLWAHPASPADEHLPPWTEPHDPLGTAIMLKAPGPNEVLAFDGRLQDVLEQPARDYHARALVGGLVVSNEAMTAADGSFHVLVPMRSIPAGEGTSPVTIELAPNNATAPQPRLTLTSVVPGDPRLATMRLPAVARAETFRFPVTGGGLPIAGATLRFRTNLPATAGEAQLQRDTQTDANGIAEVMLVPGTTDMARMYSVTVIPPASSPYEPRCVSAYPIVASGSTSPRTVAALALQPKVTVSGHLEDASGQPAPGVSVTATLVGGLASDACGGDVTAPPAATVTDATGTFTLPLARGTYDLEYAPSAGSALPLLRSTNVPVTEDVDAAVRLPAPQLVSGLVVDAAGKPTSGVDVRIFAPAVGDGTPPTLVGRALSGTDGTFRLVVATPP